MYNKAVLLLCVALTRYLELRASAERRESAGASKGEAGLVSEYRTRC